MKILFLVSTGYIVHMLHETEPFKTQYDHGQDSFLHWKFAALPCLLLAVIVYLYLGNLTFISFSWYFSIFLEAVAILPQMTILRRYREIENLTVHYVFFLGFYRFLYLLSWLYRSFTETAEDAKYIHRSTARGEYVVYACGIIQSLLYVEFFYFYASSKYKGSKFNLPLRVSQSDKD